ncbi:hypothetical protein GF327_01905 [Candidatus Woesearchaeota archaeon]|nr:hypothetical protein [Candidatus Woesearchaeota archaeon]
MKRMYLDCSEILKSDCSVRISGSKDEVMRVAMKHAVEDQKYPDNS